MIKNLGIGEEHSDSFCIYEVFQGAKNNTEVLDLNTNERAKGARPYDGTEGGRGKGRGGAGIGGSGKEQ